MKSYTKTLMGKPKVSVIVSIVGFMREIFVSQFLKMRVSQVVNKKCPSHGDFFDESASI
jgi:hypothetical protein